MKESLNNMKINKLLFTALIFIQISVLAQETSQGFTPEVVPPSPNAASIGKFGNIPISYYTGTVQVNSPLYTVSEGKIQVPISLNYHPSGIKVAEEASQVGLGWALNAGGVVSRTVMGQDDFEDNRYFSDLNPLPQNMIPQPLVQEGQRIPEHENLSNYQIVNPQYQTVTTPLYIEDGYANEYEPDHFSFSFPGGGGKFYVTRDKQILQDEKNDMVIKMIKDPELSGASSGLDISWEITTTDGTKYIFDEIETYYIPNSNPRRHVSSWFLKKIKPYTGPEVTFEYQKIYNAKNYPQGSISETIERVQLGSGCPPSDFTGAVNISPSGPQRAPVKYMETVFLDKINFSNGHVKFNFGDREDLFWDKKLENIEIYKNTVSGTELHKQMVLNYDYFDCDLDSDNFEGTGEGSISKRLKLLSVDEIVSDGEFIKQFAYEYYEGESTTTLPSKTSFAIDHWGYFNGKVTNESLLPSFTSFPTDNALDFYYGLMTGTERNAAKEFGKAYSLKKIIYPTGGYTELDYETHKFDVRSSKARDQSVARNIPVVEKIDPVFYYYDITKKDTIQNFNLDLSNAVVAQNNNTTKLKIQTFLRLGDSTSCSQINAYENVVFEIVNTEDNFSIGPFHILTMPECVEGGNVACVNLDCGEKFMRGIAFSTEVNLHPGNYVWRVKAGDGDNYIMNDFAAAFTWFQSKTATLGASDYAGGIRIKKIVDFDGSQKNVKNFNYETTEVINGEEITKSTGKLMTLPQYNYAENKWCFSSTVAGNQYIGTTHIFRSSNSIIPLNASASGSIVGYDKVEVTLGENGEFGKSIYYYDNNSDIVNNYGYYRTPTIASIPYEGNGLLMRQEDYKYKNGQYYLVKEVVNDYLVKQQFHSQAQSPFLYGAEFRPTPVFLNGIIAYPKLHAFFYPLVTEKYKYLRGSTERIYDSEDGLSYTETKTSTVFPSPIYNASLNTYEKTYFQPNLIITKNSQNDFVEKEIKYAYDYNAEPYLSLKEANIIASPIVEITILKNKQISKKSTIYDTFGAFILPKSITTQRLSTDLVFNELTINNYDTFGNITSYTERNGITTDFEYYGTSDLGKFNLVKSKTISGEGLAQTSQYDYFPLVGLKSIIQPNNISNTYSYDNFYRLLSIRDNNGNILKSYKYNYVIP